MLKFKDKNGKIVGTLRDDASEPEIVISPDISSQAFEDDELEVPSGVKSLEEMDEEDGVDGV